jgi:hypothetical protein
MDWKRSFHSGSKNAYGIFKKRQTIWRVATQGDRRIILNGSTGNNYWGCGLD